MIVAVITMRMMQVVINQIVYMVSMRHCLVPASAPMYVAWLVTDAPMLRRAPVGIGRGHLDYVLIDMVAMDMVEMPVVQVVDMTVMTHGRMPAIRGVNVRMIGLLWVGACRHGMPPRFSLPRSQF